MTTPLRRIVCFIVYTAMCVGGGAVVAVQLFVSPVIVTYVFAGAAMLMSLSGIGFAVAHDFWPLLIVAFVGTLNPSASDVSLFVPLEQTALTNTVYAEKRTSLFAFYSLIGSLVGAIGSLFAGAPNC